MAGYFGTDAQRRLQAQAEASAAFVAATAGACQTGRTMGCDDIDRLGLERIEDFLRRDGVCGFRLIARDRIDELQAWLAQRGFRFDSWDVYMADRPTALAATEAILAKTLPDEIHDLKKPSEPESDFTIRLQSLMAAAGIVPFSGSMLAGELWPATTVAIGRPNEDVIATAHGYMPHNAESAFHRYAWGGLVAVDPAERGKGLGNHINARMIASVFMDLDATHIYELVSASNVPSRRMVEACGLRHDSSRVCGVASPNESGRFTR